MNICSMRIAKFIFVVSSIFVFLLKTVAQEQLYTTNNTCLKIPSFVKKWGYMVSNTGFSTAEKNIKGLCLVTIDSNQKRTIYQHNTWSKYGYLSSMCFDQNGNIYLIPIPFISMLNLEPEKMNKILVVNAKTGIMNEWLNLTSAKQETITNPYATMGIGFDCFDSTLTVATILGSKRKEERGKIYRIKVTTKKIIDSIMHTDAMSVAIQQQFGINKLFFGSSRDGKIYSYEINQNGKFKQESKKLEFSLQNLGPRGDDKARKIKFLKPDLVEVYGTAFNYNLQAISEKPETVYTFQYSLVSKRWILMSVK